MAEHAGTWKYEMSTRVPCLGLPPGEGVSVGGGPSCRVPCLQGGGSCLNGVAAG